MMKKICMLLLLSSITIFGYAQKYAYVDTEYILSKIPEYETAQKKLDASSIEWQNEIETRYEEINKMERAYQAEKVVLPAEELKIRKTAIDTKRKEARELQKKRFGPNGDLFKKRKELIDPIQGRVFDAVREFAQRGSYAVIFDKSSDLIMLYTNPKYNKSDQILKELGVKGK